MKAATLLVVTCAVLVTSSVLSYADEPAPAKNKQENSQPKFNVTLANGLYVQAVGYTIQGDYVYLRFPSGAWSKFKKEQVNLSSLPPEGASSKSTAVASSTNTTRTPKSDRSPPGDLRSFAAAQELTGKPEINIRQTEEEKAQREREREAWIASLSEEQREYYENPSKAAEDSLRQLLMMGIADGSLSPELLRSPNSSSAGAWLSVGDEHWIKSKHDGGGLLILEDGSLWEIQRLHRVVASFWYPGSEVVVLEADNCFPGFNYSIVNTDADEVACAKYVVR